MAVQTKKPNPYNLTDEAYALIKGGPGGKGGFKTGSPTYRIALQIASAQGPLTPEQRKTIAETEKVTKESVDMVVRKLRVMKLYNDEEGGLGRVKVDNDVDLKLKTTSQDEEHKVPSQGLSTEGCVRKVEDGEHEAVSKVGGQAESSMSKWKDTVESKLGKEEVEKMMDEHLQRFLEAKGLVPKALIEEPKPQLTEEQQKEEEMFGRFAKKILELKKTPEPSMDATKLKELLTALPPQYHKLLLNKKEGETVAEDTMLQTFQYLEKDMSPVDIMETLNLTVEELISYIKKYNEMKELEQIKSNTSSPYMKGWYDVAREIIGENVRRTCDFYSEVEGICSKWQLEDIPKSYRNQLRGLFRSSKKKDEGYLINVEGHPEICATCPIGYSIFRDKEREEA